MATTTGTTTLADFLLARIAEDEAVAREASARNGAAWLVADLGHNGARITGATEFGNPRSYGGDDSLWDDEGALGMFKETAAHIVRHDPARVLAECEAKRRLIELGEKDSYWEDVLATLARPYADHPDYRDDWA